MKILFLNFDRKERGTYYRPYNWAKYLAGQGHEVTVACVSTERKFRPRMRMEHGYRILETPNFMDGSHWMMRLTGTWGWGALDIACRLGELRRGDYDVVHTFEHFLNSAGPTYLVPRKKLPVLVSDWCDHYGKGGLRDSHSRPYRLGFFYRRVGYPLTVFCDFLERHHRKMADAVTVISTYLANRARDIGVRQERIRLIPGSVDCEQVKPMPKEEARRLTGVPSGTRVVSFLGAHQEDLGFSLEAFRQVLRDHPQTVFHIIGRKESGVGAKIRELGLAHYVRQTGWCKDKEMCNYLGATDVFLLPMQDTPANRARWPNKIGEYMASGRPTVCTRVGDVAEVVVREGIGLASEPTTEAFAYNIVQLLDQPALAMIMGKRARQVAEQKYDVHVQGKELEELYASLLGSN
jgi:glycosyltransferase involved in cell wall biosynthesis